MTNVGQSFLLTSLAGLSTMLGTIFIFFKHRNEESFILKSLAFAAGVMITVSFTDLIPEGQILLRNYFYPVPVILISSICLVSGMVLSITLDHFLSAKSSHIAQSKLYHVGIISMLAIILHNIPEGIATFMTTTHNINLGISLTIAIALHNIPEGCIQYVSQ